jgi:hypothetical protein
MLGGVKDEMVAVVRVWSTPETLTSPCLNCLHADLMPTGMHTSRRHPTHASQLSTAWSGVREMSTPIMVSTI